MKLQFKNQEFQFDAVNAVVDLFNGQEKSTTSFSIVENPNQINLFQNEFGVGNGLLIEDDKLFENMHLIQKRNKLPQTNDKKLQFSVEMETGTGKTYVYTKTILELNKRYGFTKFIIVVPSLAIREGVYKSLQVTQEHFSNHYDNVPYRYFIYNSSKLSDVRAFATSNNIEIMIINIDAFKKAENIINQEQDKLNGETAMRYIQDTNPIVIIDEPQSVDNTDKSKEAIASLNPLCVLRYSATHREKINLLYKLTPVDAYQMGLVKQICVSSNSVINDFNKPYIALKSVNNDNGFRAKVEIDIENKDKSITRKIVTVKPNDDLFDLSGERELYKDYIISGIDCTDGFEAVEFSNSEYIKLGKAIGNIDEMALKRTQIYRTIEAHFDKELRYFDKGIKVLSLFFIDEVKKYRAEDGKQGIYAKMFEECYEELSAKPKYQELKKYFNTDVKKAHDGYFSQDKKGILKNTKGDTQADDSTYNTIMKDKEKLLSFECPLRFIFSHSALKEGWDNPNVFQVCTLIEQKSTFTCRQKIGRGLRLCVNQNGERIEDRNINILHVMANESFNDFASTLQKEIEQETGMKFGVFQLDMLIGLTYEEEQIIEKEITEIEAKKIVTTLKKVNAIDDSGKMKDSIELDNIEVTDSIKKHIEKLASNNEIINEEALIGKNYTEIIPEKTFTYEQAVEIEKELKEQKVISKEGKLKETTKAQLNEVIATIVQKNSLKAGSTILDVLNKINSKLPIKNVDNEVKVRLKKEAFLSPEFIELWNKIKQKTTYRVQIDSDKLIQNCINELKEMPIIPKARIVSALADIDIKNEGITHIEKKINTIDIKETYDFLPDILRLISSETQLKRSTIADIIKESGRAKEFLNNPQAFYEKTLEIIKRNRHSLAIDGIKYIKLDNQEYYAQEIFDSSEIIAYLDKNAIKVENSVHDYVIYDSKTIEKPFAKALDDDDDVKMFFKIPSRFQIETPIGPYNPDWAVYLEKDGEQKLYFVLETKGTSDLFGIRPNEKLKIHCAKRHFESLENEIEFPQEPVTNWSEFKASV